jgi:hypothetical protein
MSDNIKVTVEFPRQFIKDQVDGAHIGYWAYAVDNYRDGLPGVVYEFPCEDEQLRALEDSEEPEALCPEHKLDWKRAIKLAITKYPKLLDEREMDASTGDLWVQLAAFGKVVYG